MNKSEDFKVNQLIHKIGLKYNLRDIEVKEIVESQFRFTYEIIKGLNLKNLTELELKELKTNFIYKYLGKLYINKQTINLIKEDGNKK